MDDRPEIDSPFHRPFPMSASHFSAEKDSVCQELLPDPIPVLTIIYFFEPSSTADMDAPTCFPRKSYPASLK